MRKIEFVLMMGILILVTVFNVYLVIQQTTNLDNPHKNNVEQGSIDEKSIILSESMFQPLRQQSYHPPVYKKQSELDSIEVIPDLSCPNVTLLSFFYEAGGSVQLDEKIASSLYYGDYDPLQRDCETLEKQCWQGVQHGWFYHDYGSPQPTPLRKARRSEIKAFKALLEKAGHKTEQYK